MHNVNCCTKYVKITKIVQDFIDSVFFPIDLQSFIIRHKTYNDYYILNHFLKKAILLPELH